MFRVAVANVLRAQHACRVPSKRVLKKMKGHPSRWRKPEPELEPLRWQPAQFDLAERGVYGWAPPTGETPADLPFRVRGGCETGSSGSVACVLRV